MPRTGKARTYENTRKAAGQSSIAGKLGTGAAPKLPFDLRKFGTIETPAPPMFPYEAGDGGMPFPVMPDVLGCGEAAIQFLNRFTIPEGRARGLPVGDNLAPFMRAAVLNIFGHRDVATWTRYIRAVMFTAPRKSMKSWLSAIVAILFLYSEQERAGEILITATAQRQSRRIFDLILGTLRTNPELFKQLRVQDMFSTITNTTTATKIVATPANPEKLWGLSPSVILADEAHAWSGEKGQKLWNSLITGQGARSNPLWIISSTCPDDPPAPDDVYAQQLSYALKVQSGAVDDRRYLPMLWVCPSDADIADEDVWRRYNPGLGYSLTLEEIREEFARAKESNGLHGFRAMRLNQIPLSSLDEGWLSPDTIERCCQEAVTLDDIADCGLKAIGLDMGGARDLASIAILGVTDEGQLIARQMSWLSRAGFELIRGRAPLQEFVRRGELTITGDDAVPSEEVASDLIDIAARLGIHEVAVDPAMTALIAPALEAAGLEVRPARQGVVSMTPAMHFVEELASEGLVNIGTDTLFKWALTNVAVQASDIGRKPTKRGRDESNMNANKIDPVSALLTGSQLLIEQRLADDSQFRRRDPGVIFVDPYVDPIDAKAVAEGFSAGGSSIMLSFERYCPITGGVIIA